MTTELPPPNAPQEPLLTVGAVTAIAAAAVSTAVAFGLNLSDAQQTALLALVGVVAPVVVALWGRSKVYAPATVRAMLKR